MLYCRPDTNGIHYSVRFASTVIDGTSCRQGVNGICVDGRCEVSFLTTNWIHTSHSALALI